MNLAIVETTTRIIVNRVVLDDQSEWTPEDGYEAVADAEGQYDIGGTLVDGNYTPPEIHVEPMPKPQSASKLGLIRALREAGTWPAIKAAIAADETMQEDWDAAQEIRRTDPLVQTMIASQDLSEDQVDHLLERARELVI